MTYSQRKFTLTKKQLATMGKWASAQPKKDEGISERQRGLWESLNQWLDERGAAIVSVKYANPVRIEVPPESDLPERLKEFGYDPVFLEQTTRIGAPVSTRHGWRTNLNTGYSFHITLIYELRLPSK